MSFLFGNKKGPLSTSSEAAGNAIDTVNPMVGQIADQMTSAATPALSAAGTAAGTALGETMAAPLQAAATGSAAIPVVGPAISAGLGALSTAAPAIGGAMGGAAAVPVAQLAARAPGALMSAGAHTLGGTGPAKGLRTLGPGMKPPMPMGANANAAAGNVTGPMNAAAMGPPRPPVAGSMPTPPAGDGSSDWDDVISGAFNKAGGDPNAVGPAPDEHDAMITDARHHTFPFAGGDMPAPPPHAIRRPPSVGDGVSVGMDADPMIRGAGGGGAPPPSPFGDMVNKLKPTRTPGYGGPNDHQAVERWADDGAGAAPSLEESMRRYRGAR